MLGLGSGGRAYFWHMELGHWCSWLFPLILGAQLRSEVQGDFCISLSALESPVPVGRRGRVADPSLTKRVTF